MKITPSRLVMWSQLTAALLFGSDFLYAITQGHRGPAFAEDLPLGLASAVCLGLFTRRYRRLRALR